MSYVVEENFSDADWTWVGQDKNGFLATFTTAGRGPAPVSLFQRAKEEEIFEIEDEVLKLPEITSSTLNSDANYQNFESYLKLSRRGFYSFDWSDVHKDRAYKTRVYELISKPTKPRKISAFLEDETKLLFVVRLPEADFELGDVADIKV